MVERSLRNGVVVGMQRSGAVRVHGRSGVLWMMVGFVACLLVSCAGGEERDAKESVTSALPVIKTAPDFSGTDQDGNAVGSSRFAGSIWVASFMFTSCQGVCPVMNTTLRDVQEAIKDPAVRFVSFTVDPESDSLRTLSEYAQRYSADPRRWFF
ncbi:MAG: SCO family protein, partial [Candidatus Kapaibacterium sp.]